MRFPIGAEVRRRRGTLGATGDVGVVLNVEMQDGFEMVTVRFPRGTETFNWDVYELNEEIRGPNLITPHPRCP